MLSTYWVAATFGLKWFLEYCQRYGVPFLYGLVGKKTDKSAVNTMLGELAAAGYGVFDEGTEIKDLSAAMSTSIPQKDLLEMADRQCDIYTLGQTLTSDVGDSGSRALGDVHREVEADQYDSVCDFVGQVLTYQFARSIVEVNWGEGTEVPTVCAKVDRPKDEVAMANRDKILYVDMGLPVAKSHLHEKYGSPEPQEGEELLEVKKPVPPQFGQEPPDNKDDDEPEKEEQEQMAAKKRVRASRINKLTETVLEDLTGVAADWLGGVKPHFDRLTALALSGKVSDADFVEALQASNAQLPELFGDLDTEALAAALERAQIAMLAGADQDIRDSKKAGKEALEASRAFEDFKLGDNPLLPGK